MREEVDEEVEDEERAACWDTATASPEDVWRNGSTRSAVETMSRATMILAIVLGAKNVV
jgi:hypothetical protein